MFPLPIHSNEDVHNIQWKIMKISPIGPIIKIGKLKTIISIYSNVCCYPLPRAYLVLKKHFHTIWLLHFIHNIWYKILTIMGEDNFMHIQCCNLNLGFVTKAKAYKGAGQKWNLGVTFYILKNVGECEGMNPTLPNELPLWELESQWILEFSKGNCKGHNSLDW
jgi:hypothetical protein